MLFIGTDQIDFLFSPFPRICSPPAPVLEIQRVSAALLYLVLDILESDFFKYMTKIGWKLRPDFLLPGLLSHSQGYQRTAARNEAEPETVQIICQLIKAFPG